MAFINFKEAIQKNVEEMQNQSTVLYEVNCSKDVMWDIYLDSFPAGSNLMFRERTVHDCSCCKYFIKTFGNVVAIIDGKIRTIWDINLNDEVYQVVADAVGDYVRNNSIMDIFVSKEAKIGTNYNFELIDGNSHKWDHFYIELQPSFVTKSNRTIAEIKGGIIDNKNVLVSSARTITQEAVEDILALIDQGSLYRGNEYRWALNKFNVWLKEYNNLQTEKDKDLFAWQFASNDDNKIVCKIKNTAIGVILTDLSTGLPLNKAVYKYENTIMAPENFKRSRKLYTPKMVEDAKERLTEAGLIDSLPRRFAVADDISVNNVLFGNIDTINKSKDIFDKMIGGCIVNPNKFKLVEEVNIEDFINQVLPKTETLEVLVENRYKNNLVSLIAPENINSETMFKWNNNFSWAYNGNIADSSMKENVKAAGGNVEGDLRFSIQWNDEDLNMNDFDARCLEANNTYEIYYGNKRVHSPNGGVLDVDIIHPTDDVAAVENITYADRKTMEPGQYTFFVNLYSDRRGTSGFKAEIEFDGEIHSYEWNSHLREGSNVLVAAIDFDGTNFKIIKSMDGISTKVTSKEIWNNSTNTFVPVTIVMNSPNYWDEQNGIGNKHYFFMLKDCINPDTPNGFYVEYLQNNLNDLRKFFEVLGVKMAVNPSRDQLSGLGFSTTKRNDIIVRVDSKRIIRIKF